MKFDSILKKAEVSQVFTEPFPYLILKDPIEKNLCAELTRTFPLNAFDQESFGESNKRLRLKNSEIRVSELVSDTWKQFIETQLGDEFWHDFVRLFGSHINKLYPQLESQHGPLSQLTRGVTGIDTHDDYPLLQGCRLNINTPVKTQPTSVRGAHVDSPTKLYGCLLYFRAEEDDSRGGALELYRFKGTKAFDIKSVHEKHIEKINEIEYQNNALVLFINCPDAVHAVSPRYPTTFPRQFVYCYAEVKKSLFNVKSMQGKWYQKLRNKLAH